MVKTKKVEENVETFIKNLEHPLKDLIINLRKLILESDSQITEHIKWNAPSFCYGGDDRITFMISKPDSIQIVFHTGAKGKDTKENGPLFKDESGLFKWVADKRALIKFSNLSQLEKNKLDFLNLVNKWLELTSV